MARSIGLEGETIEQLRLAALLHDIGKIAIPDSVLQKPGGLEPGERLLVRSHVHFGYSLLEGLGIEPVDAWVLHHHEHWDGSGYPDGLAELRRQAGAQFDPAVVAALERCLSEEAGPRIEAAGASA